MRIALLLVVALTSPAAADLRWGVHMGGGLEGGLITGEPRPDGVAEAGMTVSTLLPDRNWGFGLGIESVGRLTSRYDAAEEIKLDLTVRWATANRRVRGGVGAGLRAMTFDDQGPTVMGIDLTRFDTEVEMAHWTVGNALMSVDFYFSWTFGCYHDDYELMPVGDMKPATREVRCGDTITTTYVGGLQTSVTWR